MALLGKVFFLWTLSCISAEQNQYIVSLKDVKIEFIDKHYVDVDAGLYNLNKTKAVNLTITVKTDLPEDTMVTVRAMKLLNGDYKYNPIRAEKRLKNALEMQNFGIQTLCLEYARPPIVWPLKRNMPYHLLGWIPDSSTFPPNIPQGKWKLQQVVAFSNKTKILVADWFSEVQHRQ